MLVKFGAYMHTLWFLLFINIELRLSGKLQECLTEVLNLRALRPKNAYTLDTFWLGHIAMQVQFLHNASESEENVVVNQF